VYVDIDDPDAGFAASHSFRCVLYNAKGLVQALLLRIVLGVFCTMLRI
jgi:hypothetical protein